MAARLQHLQLLLHLAAWAQLGVLTRVYVNRSFGPACGRWSCVTSQGAALFVHLPANVLGCVIIGLLSTTDALKTFYTHGASTETGLPAAAIAILPAGHSLQGHVPLLAGMRTGFCGSLTTFASWHLQVVVMMFGDPVLGVPQQWVGALAAVLLGMMTSLASLAFGQHLALWVHSQVNPWYSDASVSGPTAASPQAAGTEVAPQTSDSAGAAHGSLVGADAISIEPVGPTALSMSTSENSKSDVVPAQVVSSMNISKGATLARIAVDEDAPVYDWWHWLTDAFALCTLFLLTAISLWLGISETATVERGGWLAVLFAPVGCILRWRLADLNNKCPGSLSWLPAGTLCANGLACTVDYVLEVIIMRVVLASAEKAVVLGVIAGVSGSLSTVSTLMIEVQKLLLLWPRKPWGYIYLFGSSVAAVLLGLLIYGTAVWTI